ncbi:MAG: hypothetical protein K0U86_18305 [Planctomycetes bacterium]|uniref:hypothetical protein n=1 Tax=uncultured Gimesia sp. TaxID=1678688 RepID=UPI00260DE422|nr:hypothetical protein [uncultured Gimesia sp.]MCH9652438.1 hypothetical protein [Planctomycetota bacterium]MDF1742704.1 hypothetical protein [Gimesia sp.]MCH9726859.1 hypothetical protein [Planctomycetota bacterium]MCH9775543.1 hypothetical protein [Planctomycetota bacterium]MCH9791639.1 hypothetical protein [Planctomycetota bacterium]
MKQVTDASSVTFEDRRQNRTENRPEGIGERRQFSNSYNSENQDVNELAQAIDQYKLVHRRRFITFEELHSVVTGLGYHK